MKAGKFVYSFDEERFESFEFETREEALAEALAEARGNEDDAPAHVWTGVSVSPDVGCSLDPDEILEHLAGRAADDTLGSEYGEDWPSPSDEAAAELAKIVEEFNGRVDAWVKAKCPPTWFGVEQVQRHDVPARGAETAPPAQEAPRE